MDDKRSRLDTWSLIRELRTPSHGLFSDLRNSINELTGCVEHLHNWISLNPSTDLKHTVFNSSKIFETLSPYLDDYVTTSISEFLENYFKTNDPEITSFQTSVVYPLHGSNRFWPLLQWIENAKTNVMAIFDIEDDESDNLSCMMHWGLLVNDREHEGMRWGKTAIAWQVTDFNALGTLFQAAQHALGVLEWPREDAFKLYCKNDDQNCPAEEYNSLTSKDSEGYRLERHTDLLFDHILKIHKMDSVFTIARPFFEKISFQKGTFLKYIVLIIIVIQICDDTVIRYCSSMDSEYA